jgi:hypothetical protein
MRFFTSFAKAFYKKADNLFELKNKIVQRFYKTPAPLKAGRDLINRPVC